MKQYDLTSPIWPNKEEKFFPEFKISPLKQESKRCVSTALGMLSGRDPKYFYNKINTQNPISWSDALKEFGLKLAYCTCDVRKLKFYIDELISYDDLFLLCYYLSDDSLRDPNGNGWLCSSHVVILYKDEIYDPASGTKIFALDHSCNDYHTKRIFRVVPVDYHRGL